MGTTGNTLPPENEAIQFASPDDAKLFFSGPPQHLTGSIPLINTGSDKQTIRSISVNAGDLKGQAQLPLREIPFAARLHPNQQVTIAGAMAVDPRTPPGSYEIEVKLGSRTLPATVHVTEVVDLRMEPGEITILAGSAGSYTRRFVIENAGNTDLPLGARCDAPVFDSFDLVSSMLIGLHKADKASVESMTRGFLREWSELQAGTLVVNREPIILRPGQKVAADAEFQLPPELKPLRHYQAQLQLYNATLSVDIYTTAKTGSANRRKAD